MTAATALIPGLDEIVRNGDPERRAEAARRIAALFLQDAATLRPKHVDLFDGLLIDLVPHADIGERADLAERLSLLANAPRMLVGQLARENEILVAGPLLRRSPVLDERALLDIASAKGQGHLLAMSERPRCPPRSPTSSSAGAIARWCGARPAMPERGFPSRGYSELVRRANWDGVLTLDDRPAARSLRPAFEGAAGAVARRGSPPSVRRRQAGAAGRDQAGDRRD